MIDPYNDEMRSRARMDRVEKNLEIYSEKLNAHIPLVETQTQLNNMLMAALKEILPKKTMKRIRALTPKRRS